MASRASICSLIAHLFKPKGDDAGALGIVWGARSVAIFFAALPPDPVFSIFVALYQIPMAGLAMLHQWLRRCFSPQGKNLRILVLYGLNNCDI